MIGQSISSSFNSMDYVRGAHDDIMVVLVTGRLEEMVSVGQEMAGEWPQEVRKWVEKSSRAY